MNESRDTGRKYWLDDPRNHDKLSWWLLGICIVVLLADLAYTKHPVFAWEGWFGFFAFFGFVACVGLVLAAKAMRKLIKRDEDYYDR